jgi:superkiller protein 3
MWFNFCFRVRIGLTVILVTSLVHLFPPKHHPRALPIIDNILSQSPDNVGCLMGRAYILQAAQKWSDAGALFARVVNLIPEDLEHGLRAKEEHAWCQSQADGMDRSVPTLQSVLGALSELVDRDLDCARCLWRLGKCHWDMGGERLCTFPSVRN